MEKLSEYIARLNMTPCDCKSRPGPPTCIPNWPCQGKVPLGANALVSGAPLAAVEPLLQHYGFRTRWVDAVDNVWVALWFACHEVVVRKNYAHHARRDPNREGQDWAYLSLVSVGDAKSTAIPGVWRSPQARLIDLRVTLPSIYVRPHAQHGLLFADSSWNPARDPDLIHLVVATVQVALREALAWMGSGLTLSPYVLFPPATVDEGYRRLLDYAAEGGSEIGSILNYGSGW